MAKQKQANVGKKEQTAIEKPPVIVYKETVQAKSEKTFSFTVSEEQSAFIKAHRKTINFSDTFRKYLESIRHTVEEPKSKK